MRSLESSSSAVDSSLNPDTEDAQHIPLEGARAEGKKRATQTVPPATRREVLRRQSACAVPGCRNHRHRHVHHVKPRNEGGGDHDPLLLVALCHRHHALVHDGTLVIGGDAEKGFTFRHEDRTAYGQPLEPAQVEMARQAFEALRELGFKMSRAQKLIEAVQREEAPGTLEEFVRAALRASG